MQKFVRTTKACTRAAARRQRSFRPRQATILMQQRLAEKRPFPRPRIYRLGRRDNLVHKRAGDSHLLQVARQLLHKLAHIHVEGFALLLPRFIGNVEHHIFAHSSDCLPGMRTARRHTVDLVCRQNSSACLSHRNIFRTRHNGAYRPRVVCVSGEPMAFESGVQRLNCLNFCDTSESRKLCRSSWITSCHSRAIQKNMAWRKRRHCRWTVTIRLQRRREQFQFVNFWTRACQRIGCSPVTRQPSSHAQGQLLSRTRLIA